MEGAAAVTAAASERLIEPALSALRPIAPGGIAPGRTEPGRTEPAGPELGPPELGHTKPGPVDARPTELGRADRPLQLGLPLPGLRRLFSCTPSRLAAFDCPRRYRLTYLERPAPPKGPPWAHNTLGAVVHLALHRWWSAPMSARTPAHAGALVERHWTDDGFRDDEQSTLWRHRARQWTESYAATLDPQVEPIGVERTVAATTEALAVSGRADRIDDRDGELVIVDYKTGRRSLTADDARGSTALALYAIGARRIFRRPCLKVELHHLPTGTVASYRTHAGHARTACTPGRGHRTGHRRGHRHLRERSRRRRRVPTRPRAQLLVVRPAPALPGRAAGLDRTPILGRTRRHRRLSARAA